MTPRSQEPPDIPEVARRIFDERTQALSRPAANDETASADLLILAIGERHVAFPPERAREILRPGPITRISAGGHLVGVRSVRGEILPLADLAELLRLTSAVAVSERWVAVVDDPRVPLGLLVDAPLHFMSVPADELPQQSEDGRLVLGLTRDGALVLDIDAVLRDPRLFLDATSDLPA